jgi:predicted nucleotidyltransferase
VFDYQQAIEVRDAFEKHDVRYLFLGKSGAVLLGFPDTTQDVDVFVEKSVINGQNLVPALQELGFELTERQIAQVQTGQDFVQLKNGPFDLDLIFAPDGIETFLEAWNRQVQIEGFRVCSLDDIIASKQASGRKKDLESLPRLRDFRDWWYKQQRR